MDKEEAKLYREIRDILEGIQVIFSVGVFFVVMLYFVVLTGCHG